MTPLVPELFPGETIVCIGGGSSLTDTDVQAVRGKGRVIAINDAYRICPWADVLYGADKDWWIEHQGVPSFIGPKYALPEATRKGWPEGITVLKTAGDFGLSRDPSTLATGGSTGGRNSGYQAINLAVHLGASRILLLGYDMQRGPSGKTHWFGRHPDTLRRNSPYTEFLKGFPTLVQPLAALGVEVINCTRDTALLVFPMMPIDQALSVAVAA